MTHTYAPINHQEDDVSDSAADVSSPRTARGKAFVAIAMTQGTGLGHLPEPISAIVAGIEREASAVPPMEPSAAALLESKGETWDADCCYGNFDDAHMHGIAMGWHRADAASLNTSASRHESQSDSSPDVVEPIRGLRISGEQIRAALDALGPTGDRAEAYVKVAALAAADVLDRLAALPAQREPARAADAARTMPELDVERLARAIHPEGGAPTVDCCQGSIFRNLYPDDAEDRHRAQHREQAKHLAAAYRDATREPAPAVEAER